MNRKEDQEMLAAGRPYLRSVLAFLLRMRDGRMPVRENVEPFYQEADCFLNRLNRDLIDWEYKQPRP
jgi:hypothetical protein